MFRHIFQSIIGTRSLRVFPRNSFGFWSDNLSHLRMHFFFHAFAIFMVLVPEILVSRFSSLHHLVHRVILEGILVFCQFIIVTEHKQIVIIVTGFSEGFPEGIGRVWWLDERIILGHRSTKRNHRRHHGASIQAIELTIMYSGAGHLIFYILKGANFLDVMLRVVIVDWCVILWSVRWDAPFAHWRFRWVVPNYHNLIRSRRPNVGTILLFVVFGLIKSHGLTIY